jgi:thymidylate synthase (FAD)
MQFVDPRVIHLAATEVDRGGLHDYLEVIGAPDWRTDKEVMGNAQELIEVAGRSCYRSFDVDLNPNLTKVRTGNESYLGNILEVRHGSVLEHGTDSYALVGVSRVLTHELVRHRVGTAFSQESLRFVRLTDLVAYYPDAFKLDAMMELYDALGLAAEPPFDGTEVDAHAAKVDWAEKRAIALRMLFVETFEHLEGVQARITQMLMLDDLPGDFGLKKRITSAMRRLAPIGLGTAIVITGNHNIWRHMIQMRTSGGAEEEIRKVFAVIADDLFERYPNLYQDHVIRWVHGLREITFGE